MPDVVQDASHRAASSGSAAEGRIDDGSADVPVGGQVTKTDAESFYLVGGVQVNGKYLRESLRAPCSRKARPGGTRHVCSGPSAGRPAVVALSAARSKVMSGRWPGITFSMSGSVEKALASADFGAPSGVAPIHISGPRSPGTSRRRRRAG